MGHFGVVALIADSGTLLVRRPRTSVGRRFRESAIFADEYKYLAAGTYIGTSIVDHVRRLFAFQRLGRYPVVINVAFAEKEYLAGWQSDARANFIALMAVVVLIGGLAGGLGVQIGRRKAAEEALARLALLDGLTSLANRRQFDTVLANEWRRSARDKTPLSLLMIDVDNFKAYNDRYGHQQGDAVLISIARTIASSIVRPGDLVARYGGEEFAVILPETDAVSALHVAERVRLAVVALGVPHAGAESGIASVSIGVADTIPVYADAASALVNAADTALYDAKRAGRNRSSVQLDIRDYSSSANSIVIPASA